MNTLSLRSIALKSPEQTPEGFPFSLPLVQGLGVIEFDSPVTFLVGENGCGKSTILEAVAVGAQAVAAGAHELREDPTLGHARRLAKEMKFVRGNTTGRGFFFRSEDFFGFTKRVIREGDELRQMEKEFGEKFTGYGRMLAVGMAQGQRKAFEARYGEDPDAKSHGEGFLEFFRERIVPGGLYLLDEPETPLSPVSTLAFISMLKHAVAQSCQFIIATHSPMLMAFPEATIMSFDHTPPKRVGFEEVEHVTLTRSFLNNPDQFLRRL